MAKDHADQTLDRELDDLPAELRWREWMRRIEAVLFASASPVPREDLARVVGQGASVDLLIEDLIADLDGRAFEVAKVAGGWMLRTRSAYAAAIRTAADVGDQTLDLREYDVAVLAAIAYHQPITRDGLKDIFGKEISRDLIGRLQARGLIGTGPRSPRRGAPYTYVTTEKFLAVFDLESLQDLPDREQLTDAGLAAE
ncbi:MAG: SMC-Scp complex subunit ScpB [Pseudomonadota bacterium]